MGAVGQNIPRKDADAKVTGLAKYTDDLSDPGGLHAVLVTSTEGHARILSVDTHDASRAPGVRAVLTGRDMPVMTGDPIKDRPILAIDTVRYAGEPVAIVIADELYQAQAGAALVRIAYQPLPVLQSPRQAFAADAPLIHPNLRDYHWTEEANPVPGTNIATKIHIRKGNAHEAFRRCDVVVECQISFPQSHHAPMETHCAKAKMTVDGHVEITTSTQSPYSNPRVISETFGIRESNVRVETPFVGGGFGGKSSTYIEPIVVAAAEAANGKTVQLRCTREQDMMTVPCHIGLEAVVRLGATLDGRLVAAEISYWFDGGGYSDRGVIVARAAAQDCTGPYRIDHVECHAYCMYTNHPPTTSFRGFGHPEQTLVMERAMDELAKKLSVDPLELRRINAILPGDTTPTQARLTRSSIGDVRGCLNRLQQLLDWQGPNAIRDGRVVRARGIACVWKTSSTPPNASSGAIVYVKRDGGVTVVSGIVEIGQGTKTALTQIVADVFRIHPDRVDVVFDVNTDEQPEHWKTVASRGSLLAGNAALRAATDAVHQLTETAALAFGCNPQDVRIEDGFAYCPYAENPIPIGDLSHGYVFPDGHTAGSLVVGRGSYTIEGVTPIDFETGHGVPGPEWTVAAQGVEVEYRSDDYTYRVIRAVTVVDAGGVLHPELALGQVKGAMSMGIGLATREGYVYDRRGAVTNPQLRVYPMLRYGEQPRYDVEFLTTPHKDAPYGIRGLGEHGLIGMPAALANALSNAIGIEVNQMPMTPELLWRLSQHEDDPKRKRGGVARPRG
ncbi:aldehyde oxidase [Alicyclobacillus ferrooxydans]|uniref:Aldehyde oxidase n=2 Tax=Alicyclobacillus ferrooxydans TaxID=471514 RepID=A0A0P9CAB2_9BACL|nr:aldehyde oxidase [Alicyclobacillus ferrooxydans]